MPLLAHQVVQVALRTLVTEAWPMPARLQVRVLRALQASPCSRAVELRQSLALVGTGMDVDHFFVHVCTPRFAVALMEDLRATGAISQIDAAHAQSCILTRVTRAGAWVLFKDFLNKER
jgi:hypothetical protein